MWSYSPLAYSTVNNEGGWVSAFTSWAFVSILCSQERQSLLFTWANSSENCPSGLIDVYPVLVDQKAWKRLLAHGNLPTAVMHLRDISGRLYISPILWSLWKWVYLYSLGSVSMVWKSESLENKMHRPKLSSRLLTAMSWAGRAEAPYSVHLQEGR